MPLFDHSAHDYDSWCKTPMGSYVDLLEKQLMNEVAQPKKGEIAIDLGCGTGIYSIWLAEKGLSVTGVDLSTEMIKVAEKKTSERNLNIYYKKADLHHLPFEDNSFDLAVCNIALEFADSPEKVIEEGLRVLKKGGRLVIGMIGKNSEWSKIYQRRGKENKESVFAHARFFSSDEIKLLSKNQPVIQRYGLYITPVNFQNKSIAAQIEEENQALQLEEGAGYIVSRWEKSE
jgi:ubiquinone/menaquinone biosynthesis C-methylase UbiE